MYLEMPGATTIDPLDDGEEVEFHPEGVAFFSPQNSCFGMSLHEIVENTKEGVTKYGETVKMEPHSGCLEQVIQGGVDEQRILLENSIWLIDCECIVNEEFFSDFKHLIRTFPWAGNIVIWVEPQHHNLSEEDRSTVENVSTKPDVVYKRQRLLDKVGDYLEYKANPHFGCGGIRDWRNEVHRLQKSLG